MNVLRICERRQKTKFTKTFWEREKGRKREREGVGGGERSDFLLIYPYRGTRENWITPIDKTDRMIHRRPIHSAQKKQLPTKRSHYSSAVTDRHVGCELIGTRSDSFQHSLRIWFTEIKNCGACLSRGNRPFPLDCIGESFVCGFQCIHWLRCAVSPYLMQYASVASIFLSFKYVERDAPDLPR